MTVKSASSWTLGHRLQQSQRRCTYQTLGGVKLEATLKPFFGLAHQALDVLRHKLTHKQISSTQSIYVVRRLKSSLLGHPAITALRLLSQVHVTSSDKLNVRAQFHQISQGLDTLGDDYKIQLKDDAKPHALFIPRSVPVPLRHKVDEKLQRMETMGVIEKVEDPTPWCAGMVVVPKPSSAVRICMDLKHLSTSVSFERCTQSQESTRHWLSWQGEGV